MEIKLQFPQSFLQVFKEPSFSSWEARTGHGNSCKTELGRLRFTQVYHQRDHKRVWVHRSMWSSMQKSGASQDRMWLVTDLAVGYCNSLWASVFTSDICVRWVIEKLNNHRYNNWITFTGRKCINITVQNKSKKKRLGQKTWKNNLRYW